MGELDASKVHTKDSKLPKEEHTHGNKNVYAD